MIKVTDLPFNRLIGLVPSTREGCVLSLPDDIRYTNHLGTVHASALMALAEATSGAYLISALNGVEFKVLPVVRRVEARFRKPAFGEVHSKIRVEEGVRERFMDELLKKGRALLDVQVDVHDLKEAHALCAHFEWFVARSE